jgi:hypothetical protein
MRAGTSEFRMKQATLVLFVCCFCVGEALAYGPNGHQIVGAIAR